jgi:hypothetical protein
VVVAKVSRPDSGALAADEEITPGDLDSEVDDDSVPNLETVQTGQQNGLAQLSSLTADSAETTADSVESTAVATAESVETTAVATAESVDKIVVATADSVETAAVATADTMVAAAEATAEVSAAVPADQTAVTGADLSVHQADPSPHDASAAPSAAFNSTETSAAAIPVNSNAASPSDATAVLSSDALIKQHSDDVTTTETVGMTSAVVDSSATSQIPSALLSRLALVSDSEPQSSLFLHHEEEGEGFIEDSYYSSLRPGAAAGSCLGQQQQPLPSLNLASLGPDEGDSMVGLVSGKIIA